jgi:hypothetical protein
MFKSIEPTHHHHEHSFVTIWPHYPTGMIIREAELWSVTLRLDQLPPNQISIESPFIYRWDHMQYKLTRVAFKLEKTAVSGASLNLMQDTCRDGEEERHEAFKEPQNPSVSLSAFRFPSALALHLPQGQA